MSFRSLASGSKNLSVVLDRVVDARAAARLGRRTEGIASGILFWCTGLGRMPRDGEAFTTFW